MPASPIFILDAPHYHRVCIGETHRFRGVALAPIEHSDARVIRSVVVREGDRVCVEARVDLESPDVARILPGVAAAGRCRFACDVVVQASTYTCSARFDDGAETPVFVFDATNLEGARALLTGASAMPLPPSELLNRTQGGDDAGSYQDSIVSAPTTLRSLLGASGLEPARMRRILDVGCGTGRLLAGWHLDDPLRALTGVDIDRECVAWAEAHLRGVAQWHRSQLDPPLPFESASFDLVQLASVFTHLSLERQGAWVREVARLVRPGGAVVVTLLGEPYALMLDAAQQRALAEAGHYETPVGDEGGAGYGAFHEPWFARQLFGQAFSRIDFYPRGQAAHPPRFFPMASLQDVYILRN